MANTTVTLYRKCKTPQGWRYYPVVMSANGRVKPNAVMVDEIEVAYPVGHYVLRSYAGDKTVWTRVTGGPTEALAALKTTAKKANAVAAAADAGVQVMTDPRRIALVDATAKFVQAARDRKSPEAAEIYQRTLDDFLAGCSKTYADELEHVDVTKFHGQMYKRGLSDRTVMNRHMNLRAFLIYLKLDYKPIAGATPKSEKTMPEIYKPAELKAFFGGLTTEYDRVFYKLLLTTGLREREAMHLEWPDIDVSQSTLKVESKPRWKHKIKDAEEREMPLSREMLAALQAYHKTIPATYRLVFGARAGKEDKPDGHHLRNLKVLVRRLGLNCGTCKACIGKNECEEWFLHKFRATYITNMLRAPNMDLRTVMALSGHADIQSVMRYLRPAEADVSQKAINSIKWY
jgi:integrase